MFVHLLNELFFICFTIYARFSSFLSVHIYKNSSIREDGKKKQRLNKSESQILHLSHTLYDYPAILWHFETRNSQLHVPTTYNCTTRKYKKKCLGNLKSRVGHLAQEVNIISYVVLSARDSNCAHLNVCTCNRTLST